MADRRTLNPQSPIAHRLSNVVIALAFVIGVAACSSAQPGASPPTVDTEVYIKTELYFGMAKPDGTRVSVDEWRAFLDREISPRFPDGLTVLEAEGQYMSKNLGLIREPTRILILLHRPTVTADTLIERIRSLYQLHFQQESVLRVSTPAGVSF
jgi:hypothetical protein